MDQTAGSLKSPDAAEQLRRQPDFRFENLNKPALTQPEILCHFPDDRTRLILSEHFERRRNRVMLFRVVAQARQQSGVEQLKSFCSRSRVTKKLSQPARRRSPNRFQIDMRVGEIARRESEK